MLAWFHVSCHSLQRYQRYAYDDDAKAMRQLAICLMRHVQWAGAQTSARAQCGAGLTPLTNPHVFQSFAKDPLHVLALVPEHLVTSLLLPYHTSTKLLR